jgi:hypothetical protein
LGSHNTGLAFKTAQQAVASSPIVGDEQFDFDDSDQDNKSIPWSQRFKLFGPTDNSFLNYSSPSKNIVVYEEKCINMNLSFSLHPKDIPDKSPLSNLPSMSMNFVGRAADLVEVVRLFEKEKVQRVCVFGPGGIGKTEFAKMVGNWMRDRGHVSTVLWTSVDPAECEDRVFDLISLLDHAKSLFSLPFTDTNVDRQKMHIYQYLRTRPALFIIDGWENLDAKNRWPIWTFLNSLPSTSKVLFTSRGIVLLSM